MNEPELKTERATDSTKLQANSKLWCSKQSSPAAELPEECLSPHEEWPRGPMSKEGTPRVRDLGNICLNGCRKAAACWPLVSPILPSIDEDAVLSKLKNQIMGK